MREAREANDDAEGAATSARPRLSRALATLAVRTLNVSVIMSAQQRNTTQAVDPCRDPRAIHVSFLWKTLWIAARYDANA